MAAQAADGIEDLTTQNETYVDKDDPPIDEPVASGGAGGAPTIRVSDASVVPPNPAIPVGQPAPGIEEPRNLDSPAGRGGNAGLSTFGKASGDWSRAHASPCPSGELRCVDGRCITLAQLCDGTIDCTDHADEDNCYT